MEYLTWALIIILAAFGGWFGRAMTGRVLWGLIAGAVLAAIIELLLNQYTRNNNLLIPVIVGAVVGYLVSLATAPRRAS